MCSEGERPNYLLKERKKRGKGRRALLHIGREVENLTFPGEKEALLQSKRKIEGREGKKKGPSFLGIS